MEYDGAVLDLDGTVYRGDRALPGAAEAIERFRTAGLRTLFFSNNPTKSRDAYADRLDRLGIGADSDEVLSAGTVTTRYLAEFHSDDAIFLIGDDGLRAQFGAADLELVDDATDADVLIASWSSEFDYGDMLAGYRGLEAGAVFYGTDPDRLVPAAEGMIPGSGSIINAVAGTADRTPNKILGKPSAEAQRAALDALELTPDRCFVVGDRLDTDIELGRRAGMTTVLVTSGITTEAELDGSDIRPDYVVDSLADVPEALEI